MSKNRRRLLVALIPPRALADEFRTLRSLFGTLRAERIAPHITLVPPVNVAEADVDEVCMIARRVAGNFEPFTAGFGAVDSFAPGARTIHLAAEVGASEMADLRRRLRVGPLDREDPRTFAPHLTLLNAATDSQISAALALDQARPEELAFPWSWLVDRLYVMEQIHDDSGTKWKVLREEPFGGPTVVGRGGVEMQLRCVGHVEPLVADLVTSVGSTGKFGVLRDRDAGSPDGPDSGGDLLCVVAESPEEPGMPVGAAIGRVAGGSAFLDAVVTAPTHRCEGVAGHVLAEWCYRGALNGAALAVGPSDGYLESVGFTRLADLSIRRLG